MGFKRQNKCRHFKSTVLPRNSLMKSLPNRTWGSIRQHLDLLIPPGCSGIITSDHSSWLQGGPLSCLGSVGMPGPPATQLQSESWAEQCQSEGKLWRLSATFPHLKEVLPPRPWPPQSGQERAVSGAVHSTSPCTLPSLCWGFEYLLWQIRKLRPHDLLNLSWISEHSSLWLWNEALPCHWCPSKCGTQEMPLKTAMSPA